MPPRHRASFGLCSLRLAAGGVFLLAASSAWSGTAEVGRPLQRYYPPGEHLRYHASHTIAQDPAGFLYFGNGLNVMPYDGIYWGVCLLPPESGGMRQFATAPDGTLFVGGASVLGYIQGSGRNARFVSLAPELPPEQRNVEEIEHAAAAGDAVYFSDEERILVWRQQHFTIIPYHTPPYSHGARFHHAGDTLFVSALGHPLARLVAERLERVSNDPVVRENQIAAIVRGRTPGSFTLLTAERGFFELHADGHVTPWAVEANRWLAGKRIFRALQLSDQSWAVTFSAASGDGGMRFAADGSFAGKLDPSMGIQFLGLRDLFVDREGGLWLGMEVGITRLEWPSAMSLFDNVNGLGRSATVDVTRHAGTIHAATGQGIYRLLPPDETGRSARFERVQSGAFTALLSHPGGLLAAGASQLFVSAEGGGFRALAQLPPGDATLHRSQRDPRRVWVATAHGIQAVRFTTEGWRDEGALPDFAEDGREVIEAPDGALWVTTPAHGLFRLEVGSGAGSLSLVRAERFAGGNGLPERPGELSVVDWAGAPLFLVANSPRPLRFDAARRRFEPAAGTENWPAPAAGENFTARAGWLADSTSIQRVAGNGGPPQRLPHLALAASGSVARLLEEPGPDGGVLWICGANGLVRVELARAFTPPVPFATMLESATIGAGERLEPEHAPLTFRFIAPRFQLGSAVTYQTRLVGHDRDWSPWDAQRERFIAHLPAGDYRFEARARDAGGEISAPATLDFTVLAPWWRTNWALLGYAAAGTGLVAGVVRLRTRALRQRAAGLETVVAARTAELADKNRELTRLHRLEFDEKVAARLAEEKARLEVLRYQLNPHFLFNTLASISASLPPGRGPAHAMVERLADFCRLTLHRADDSEWTTLGAEMKLLRAYLAIEQSRWSDLLDVEIECDSMLDEERLPYFLLLPLVENALKYGRATSPDRVGIRLAIRRDADREGFVVEVANTGEWVEPSARRGVSSLGIGLDNLRERLARYYPRAHALTFSHAAGWVTVELRLFTRVHETQPAAPVV